MSEAEYGDERRLSLIERGVAGNVALDASCAARLGRRNNGRTLPVTSDWEIEG